MVYALKCDCAERIGIEINSMKLFKELKSFFEGQVQKGIFVEESPKQPYYIGRTSKADKGIEWYATKWYRCTYCGCLWEFKHPDFPTRGFVRKFSDGIYQEMEY